MEKLNIQTTLPSISFDLNELMGWAKGITSKYADLVVREEDVIGIKKDMADLNKAKAKIDTARKEAVKQVSAPIREFEEQVKEVIGIFSETYNGLKGQVQAHEERQREAKRQEVNFLIDALKDEHGVQDMGIDFNPTWLNKSKTMKAVKVEIEALILASLKAEREAAALEQARKDRVLHIQNKCEEQGERYGITIPWAQFLRLQDVSVPLVEVNEAIESAYSLKASQQAAQQEAHTRPQRPAVPTPQAHVPSPPVATPVLTKNVTVEIEYTHDQEKAVEDMLRSLQSMGVSVKLLGNAQAA